MRGRRRDAMFLALALALGLLLRTLPLAAQGSALAPLDGGGAGLLDAGAAYGPGQQDADVPDAVAPSVSEQASPFPPKAAASEPLQVVDVTVQGATKAQRLRESSAAVTVVELSAAKKQSADLGEVLARVQGISVRRAGGLGSNTRFSLNGLTDDQIRFFLDEVPLELAGYSQSIADVPLVTLDRVDIYRGVVPIRFGADALGGVVNLITPQPTRGAGGVGYYQIGSFGTHRAGLSGHYVHQPTGLFTRLMVYGDITRNDYEIDVEIPDAVGRLAPAKVERFHDAYKVAGGSLELGVVKRPWAERLILRAFASGLASELQSNLIMTVPYGAARYDVKNYGATLRYDQTIKRRLRIEALTGYSYVPTRFIDNSRNVYNWRGEAVRMRQRGGETDNTRTYDQTLYEQTAFARLLLSLRLSEQQRVELTLTPTYTTRAGEDRTILAGNRDPLEDRQSLFGLVSGVGYIVSLFDDVVENTIFGKHFTYRAKADERLPGNVYRNRDRNLSRFGVGDSLRIRLTETLYTKASYELSTRLPRPDEVFGDGVLIAANLQLKPESSHNGNLELTIDQPLGALGVVRGSANGFIRNVDQQIFLIGSTQRSTFANAYSARALGVEANGGFTSPREYVTLDANVTYVDFRNTSKEGPLALYEGDRLPSRPYLFANATAHGMLRDLLRASDELSLFYYMRYIHAFYRGWESLGSADSKQSVPRQISHALALTYSQLVNKVDLSGSLEVENLTDARLFDTFGAQRPGRAYYFKLSFAR